MDLRDYFLQNVTEDAYHSRFLKDVQESYIAFDDFTNREYDTDYNFEVYDEEEAIEKFIGLCEPNILFLHENIIWFYLLTFYLNHIGYVIKEFPKVLARPPVHPAAFTYDDIRNRLASIGKIHNGVVRYADRRQYASSLTFSKKSNHVEIDIDLNQKFMEISNRGSKFANMSTDEKLTEIANMIEHLLKKGGVYSTLDYSIITNDFITDDIVKKYRNKMHVFRHATAESLTERNQYSEEQKLFYIDFGLTILKVIYELSKQS